MLINYYLFYSRKFVFKKIIPFTGYCECQTSIKCNPALILPLHLSFVEKLGEINDVPMRKALQIISDWDNKRLDQFRAYLQYKSFKKSAADLDVIALFDHWRINASHNVNESDLKNRYHRFKTYIQEFIVSERLAENRYLQQYLLNDNDFDSLDAFFAIENLEAQLVSYTKNQKEQRKGLIHSLDLAKELNHPYYHIVKGFMFGRGYYDEHKEEFHQMSTVTNQKVYVFYSGYIARLYNSGHKDLMTELRDIYIHGIRNKIVFKDGHLPEQLFLNMLTLFGSDIDSAIKFVQGYSSQLQKEIRKPTKTKALAQLSFRDEAYQRALDLIDSLDHYELRYAYIRVFCIYKVQTVVALQKEVRKFRWRIQRENVRGKLKSRYLNTIVVLLELRKTTSPQELEFLSNRIKNDSDFLNADWLQKEIKLKNQLCLQSL